RAGERHLAGQEYEAVGFDGVAERRDRVRRAADHVERQCRHRKASRATEGVAILVPLFGVGNGRTRGPLAPGRGGRARLRRMRTGINGCAARILTGAWSGFVYFYVGNA